MNDPMSHQDVNTKSAASPCWILTIPPDQGNCSSQEGSSSFPHLGCYLSSSPCNVLQLTSFPFDFSRCNLNLFSVILGGTRGCFSGIFFSLFPWYSRYIPPLTYLSPSNYRLINIYFIHISSISLSGFPSGVVNSLWVGTMGFLSLNLQHDAYCSINTC